MALLVIDTSADRCAALVRRAGSTLEREPGADVVVSEAIRRGHDARLALVVGAALSEAGLGFGALSRVGVVVGPGSFTGVRVGVAYARGLALSLGVPAVGVNALEAWAAQAHLSDTTALCVGVHDSKRAEVTWLAMMDGRVLGPPRCEPAVDAGAAIGQLSAQHSRAVVARGTGARLLAATESTPPGWRLEEGGAPPMAILADLAAQASADEGPPAPFYQRPPDAAPARARQPRPDSTG